MTASEAELAASMAAAAAALVDSSGVPAASAHAAGNDLGGEAASPDAMSIAQMVTYLTQQSQTMANMMQMWQLDRPEAKEFLANRRRELPYVGEV